MDSQVFELPKEKTHGLNMHPDFVAISRSAFERFKVRGMPGRRHERWRYTPLVRHLGDLPYPSPHCQSVPMDHVEDRLDNAIVVHMRDGQIQTPEGLPEGLKISSWQHKFEQSPEEVLDMLTWQEEPKSPGISDLNLALLEDGVWIDVSEGVWIDRPIHIVYQTTKNASTREAHYYRHAIVLKAGARLSVVEDDQIYQRQNYFINSMAHLSCDQRAQLEWVQVRRPLNQHIHVSRVVADVHQSAHLLGFQQLSGQLLHHMQTDINLIGDKARCDLAGLYLLDQKGQADVSLKVNHRASATKSTQKYRGLLGGQSKGSFRGEVFIAEDLKAIEARQENKNLLISDRAVMNTMPILEIYSNDVVCSHGATVSQLDEQLVFYMQSRGIGRQQAIECLLESFGQAVFHYLESKEIKQMVCHTFFEQLKLMQD